MTPEEREISIRRAENKEERKALQAPKPAFVIPMSSYNGQALKRVVPHNTFLLNLALLARFKEANKAKARTVAASEIATSQGDTRNWNRG